VQLGLSDLGRLTEQLAATEAKLDRAKVDSYFPKIKGFRRAPSDCFQFDVMWLRFDFSEER
jgi:hypothetical protein